MFLTEAQHLANKYCTAVRDIRLIQRNGSFVPVIVPDGKPVPVSLSAFQQDFGEFTEKYRDELKEVRVIFKDGAGASQFFPRGTPDKVIWESVIPKEEMFNG